MTFFRSRTWRVPATGLGFALFGLGGIVLSLTVFPLLYILPVRQSIKSRCARWVISKVWRGYLLSLKALGLIKYEFHDTERLQQKGRVIIANHPSLLDVVFIIALAGTACCIVKASLWRNPFTACAVRAAGYVSNDDPQIFDKCVAMFERGESMIVFPEGTRSLPGQPLNFHRGPSNLALGAKRAITPVVIHCEPATLLKKQKWYDVPGTPPYYMIRVLPTIETDHYMADGQFQSTAARRLTRELKGLYSKELGLETEQAS